MERPGLPSGIRNSITSVVRIWPNGARWSPTYCPSADPGYVLHCVVGDPLVVFIVVNEVMHAGPVLSSYEFITPIDKRLSDAEFEQQLPQVRAPLWAR